MPQRLRTAGVPLRVDGELHEWLAWTADCHGFADVENFVFDVLTDTRNAHQDCRECSRVAQGGRPAPRPGER